MLDTYIDPAIYNLISKHWNSGSHSRFPIDEVRRAFPILAERVNGQPLVYLDNAASTFRPQCVIDRLAEYESREHSNIHRGAHELAARATDAYEDARRVAAVFINAPSERNIIFTRGTTEAVNLAAHSFARPLLHEGDEVLITEMEHHANIVPWQLVCKETGARIVACSAEDCGSVDLMKFASCFTPRTRFCSVAHVTNSIGSVMPIEEMIRIAHSRGVPVLVDGAQAAAHMPVDVAALGADCYAFSGHKACAPTGIGALYATDEVMSRGIPYQGGGHMIESVTIESSVFQPPPRKFEAGTGNISGAVGLAEALRYLMRLGMANIYAYEAELMRRLYDGLSQIDGVNVLGGDIERVCALSFTHERFNPTYIGKRMNEHGIALRAGHHCAQPALRRYGVAETVRPSVAFYNTAAEVDVLVEKLEQMQ
ncbi:MAG: cysteine desulfurase [Oscillospiraceae bacterium]|jgi:cysteine desulfurase/selenocysteine lyase|nr:cysteine desulfurase [Oscillospiraceae bacterium]